MRLLIQRVKYGSVKVEYKNYFQSIGKGLVVFVGFTHSDTLSQVDFLYNKLLNLRIFEDEKKKMNLSIQDIGGEILLVSQFTLYANTSKGNRPGFDLAMNPTQAENLYHEFAQRLQAWNSERVRLGIFGEEMLIEIHNDGPVTILLEKE